MKSLKITFAVLSLLVLTVSGTSPDSFENENVSQNEKVSTTYDLLAHKRKSRVISPTG